MGTTGECRRIRVPTAVVGSAHRVVLKVGRAGHRQPDSLQLLKWRAVPIGRRGGLFAGRAKEQKKWKKEEGLSGGSHRFSPCPHRPLKAGG